MLMFRPIVPELTKRKLEAILGKLDDVCAQAQELQRQIRVKMADAARRDYPHPERPAYKTARKRR